MAKSVISPMASKIKNIVFDFGGVLLDIEYQRTYTALSMILDRAFDPIDLPEDVHKALMAFEIGEMNVETFLWTLQRLAKKNTPQGLEVINAWNAMLIGWDVEKFDFLTELRKKYAVYLLSNTNELHLDWVYADLEDKHGIVDFDSRFFDKTYYSHVIGMRKPNTDIVEYVATDASLVGEETIFIDDIATNLEGAKSVGWQTYHHDPKENLINIFKNKLNFL